MSRTHVCVIGHGTAGRLHERLLSDLGFRVSLVDPVQTATSHRTPVFGGLGDLPDDPPVDVWSVCSPTAAHLENVAAVLAVDPAARLLVEKPVCRSWETSALLSLLARHDRARLVVMDQYSHAQALALFRSARQEFAPGHPLRALRVGFGKDRLADIAAGRFVDRDHGVFGYEWLHMLALVRGLLSSATYDRYLSTEPDSSSLRVAADPELVSTAAYETVTVDGTAVELYSTIAGPDTTGQVPTPPWFVPRSAEESRQRYVEAVAGPVRFSLHLDPVVLPNGTPLPRNMHLLSAEGPGLRREWMIHDSPLENALRSSIATLLGHPEPAGPDLRGITRIGRLAASSRSTGREPLTMSPPATPSARL
ncbi:Gfo/Idh/MocA family oxidoreductase [Streptomyces sp. NPDC087263]|uniref:Gfo/Idh/MocA family oxidoreductase n=1 Tax=Streptomyces sp. NPDC087263 TaxID=3365773 RepID=UPI003825679C